MEILKLTDPEYFALKRYSNSDLSALERHIFGIQYNAPTEAFSFGSAFHAYVLEGIKPTNATDKDRTKMENMKNKLLMDTLFWHRRNFSRKEITVLWEHNGIPLKSKLDLALMTHRQGIYTVGDLKTTTATSKEQFEQDIIKYEYDRQAAFYLDSVGAKKYEIWAVQKQAPHQVFYFCFDAQHPIIQQGRKKYRRMLEATKETNWKPTKWNTTPTLPPNRTGSPAVMGCPFDEPLPPLTHDKRAGYTPGTKMSELKWEERHKEHTPGTKMAELSNQSRTVAS